MKSKGPLGLTFEALRALLWHGARGICPKCGQGRMFRSHFQIHRECPECGVVLQPYAGDSLGVYAVCYFLTVVATVLVMAAAYFLFHLTSPYAYLALFSVTSGAILFGFFPNMKGIWIAFVYLLTGLRRQL